MSDSIVSPGRKIAVALCAAVALAILGYYTIYLFREDLQDWQVVEVQFEDVGGLRKQKDEVLVAGARMGRVADIRLANDRQVVVLELLPEVALHDDASVMIVSANSLGYVRVEIDPGRPSSPRLPPGQRLEGRLAPGLAKGASIPGRRKLLEKSLRETAQNLKDIQDPASGTLGQLLFDGERTQRLREGLVQVEDLWDGIDAGLAEIEAGRGPVGQGLDPTSIDALATTVGSFRDTLGGAARGLRGVARGEGTAGQLFADPTQTGDFRERYKGIAASLREIAAGRGVVGRLSMPGSETELDSTVSSLETLTTEARAGRGVLGVLSSPDYTQHARGFLRRTPEALGNLRRSWLIENRDARLQTEDLLDEMHDTVLRMRRAAARVRMGLPSRTFHGAAFSVF